MSTPASRSVQQQITVHFDLRQKDTTFSTFRGRSITVSKQMPDRTFKELQECDVSDIGFGGQFVFNRNDIVGQTIRLTLRCVFALGLEDGFSSDPDQEVLDDYFVSKDFKVVTDDVRFSVSINNERSVIYWNPNSSNFYSSQS